MIAEDLWRGPPSISIFSAGVIPQFIVYIAISNQTIDNINDDLSIIPYVRLAQIWMLSMFFSQILQLIYSLKTQKRFQVDHWRIIDFFQFVLIFIDFFGIHKYLFPIENDELYENNDEDGNLNAYYRHILNASIISLIVLLVWFRIIFVLITTKRLGHMIQAIYFMIKMTLNFLIIFACWLICCSAIFTAIYYDSAYEDGPSSNPYKSFSITVTTLFSASLAVYDNNFTKLKPLGDIMMSIYVVISAVMLINLLIALLTEAFTAISKQADSRHRSILIIYRHRWAWNPSHSYLIFVPPPLNMLAFLIVPFELILSDNQMVLINSFFCKSLFILIYVVPMIVVFLIQNLILLVPAYLKGFFNLRSLLLQKRPLVNLVLWTAFGGCILFAVILKDIYCILSISFRSLFKEKKKHSNKFNPQRNEIKEIQKQIKENAIYTNFIKSVINLFDEFESIQENELLKNASQEDNKGLKRTQDVKKRKREIIESNKLVDVRVFTSRFYRLLEEKETHSRNIKNPALALKGKRKKRPKIFQNFIQEKSRDIQMDLMKCYFYKKYKYDSKLIFERAYYADFGAIEKAIHKFKQKSALQKQGQNLKKINETLSDLKDHLNDFNNKGNLYGISEKLMSIMQKKLDEVKKKEGNTSHSESSQFDEDASPNPSNRSRIMPVVKEGVKRNIDKKIKEEYEKIEEEDDEDNDQEEQPPVLETNKYDSLYGQVTFHNSLGKNSRLNQ